MKKLFTLFALMLVCIGQASAYDFEVDGIYYNKLGNNAEVTYYDMDENGRLTIKYSGDVNIPNSVYHDGTLYTVTGIGYAAFYGCMGLTSITMPNSVTSIGEYAFGNCISLTSITIPNSVTNIGNEPFYGCDGLTSIKVESGNRVYDSRGNSNCIIETETNTLIVGFKNTTIPNSVTSIGDGAFKDCSGLASVTIPYSVKSIGEEAFFCCTGLTSVTIPNSVTRIGAYAFCGCSCLTSITIPNSVKSLEAAVFGSCGGLTSITIPNSVTSIGEETFGSCTGLTSITIPNSVTIIGEGAFSGCTGLTSISIPNSVKSIGARAFEDCRGLTSFTIPNSVTSIGDEAIRGCSLLTSIYCFATKPPTVGALWPRFDATLHVLKGYKDVYNSTLWGQQFKIVDDIEFSITAPSSSLFIGQNYQISVKCTLPNYIVRWSSSNENVANISNTGVVTALSEGSTVITTEVIKDGATIMKATATITVNKCSISLDRPSATLAKGQTLQLSAYPNPSNMAVTWSTNNSAVAVVSNNGLVTAKGEGTAVITVADATDASVTATCTITVKKNSITLDKSSASLYSGQVLQLTATTEPIDMGIVWSSTNPTVATVDANGIVTAKSAGTAVIIVSSVTDASVVATCTITVEKVSICLDKTSAILSIGQTLLLTATPTPSNVDVIWSSSNPLVAVVNGKGVVIGCSVGTAVITVTSTMDASAVATCVVEVKSSTDGVNNIQTHDATPTIYNASGLRISNAQRGINLQKMSNGTTKKVLMR